MFWLMINLDRWRKEQYIVAVRAAARHKPHRNFDLNNSNKWEKYTIVCTVNMNTNLCTLLEASFLHDKIHAWYTWITFQGWRVILKYISYFCFTAYLPDRVWHSLYSVESMEKVNNLRVINTHDSSWHNIRGCVAAHAYNITGN